MKITYIILLFAICLGTLLYNSFLRNELKSNLIVKEIVKMKVNQVEIDTIENKIHYEYLVGNKYRIVVSHTNAVPYKSSANDEVFIKNINGECVFSYSTKYTTAWKSDYEKLMKFLKI